MTGTVNTAVTWSISPDGLGTIDSAGPVWLLITWDKPNGFDYYHWSEALAPHLTRLATPTRETQTR